MRRRRWDYEDWPSENRRWGLWLAGGTALLAICYILGIWTGAALTRGSSQTTVEYVPPQTGNTTSTSGSLTPIPGVEDTTIVTEIYNRVKNSIFTITAVSGGKPTSSDAEEDIGTAFLIDHNGDLLTNAHVVGSATTVQVSGDNRQFVGRVIDADQLDDLAIVRIPAPKSLQPLPLGSVKSLQPGSLVIAIGNPFELTSSVSSGIVSGLNRSMSESNGHVMNGMIQTDAPLNPGNSGGPLLNAAGQVVGINTLIESPIEGSIGIGFAIPIDRFLQLEPSLLAGKPVAHAWLGIEGMDIDSLMQQALNLPVSSGVYVTEVTKGGPAAKAGLRGDSNAAKLDSLSQSANPYAAMKGDGDIIVGIDGKSVTSIEQLTQYINQDEPGQTVTLTVLRGGKTLHVRVTLGTWPSGQNP